METRAPREVGPAALLVPQLEERQAQRQRVPLSCLLEAACYGDLCSCLLRLQRS